MLDEAVEQFSLDVESDPTERYLKRVSADIARQRARTEYVVALVLVIAIVAALPVYLLFVAITPQAAPTFEAVFEKWITVVRPLAGAAVGVGARNARSASGGP